MKVNSIFILMGVLFFGISVFIWFLVKSPFTGIMALIGTIFIIGGIFENKKYYNKTLYLVFSSIIYLLC